MMRLSIRSVAIVAAAAALSTAACGNSGRRDFTIGFKRVALDLSYQDEKLAAPPTREDVVIPQPVPAQAAFLTQVALPRDLTAPAPPPLPKQQVGCAVAGDGAHPDQPATVFVTQPPAKGIYTTHNTGTIVLGGAVTVTFKFPARGIIEIRDIEQSSTDDPVNGPTQVITYDEYVPGLDGGGTTTTYRVTYSPATLVGTVGQNVPGGSHAPQGELDLVRLQMKSTAGDIDFRPQPPVTMMAFKTGQGTSWNSAGIDPNDGTSMVVQGSVVQRKNVDLCGTVYDTYEVSSSEHIVNLRTGLKSDTSATDPNVYHVATNYGGLFIQKHVNVTTSFPGKESAAPTIVTALYDQTFDSIGPIGGGAG